MATILVVDDRVEGRAYLVTLLSYRHHKLLEANDGAEALAIIRAHRPDLVITDILMPTMDGYELVRQLRADPEIASTQVIFCTADYRSREAHNLALSCGVSYLLTKPCEPDIVLRTVDEALGTAAVDVPVQIERDFERDHLRLLSDTLSQKATELEATKARLAELVQINLELTAENDTYRLLELLCRSARQLVSARYAAVGVSAADQLEFPDYFLTCGMDADTVARIGKPALDEGVLGTLVRERRAYRLSELRGNLRGVALPVHHPTVHSLLAAPIASVTHTYGWLCLTEKLGLDEFSEEDERLMALLAAQAGRVYENRSLYRDVKRHATALELEIEERRKAEIRLRQLNEELDLRVAERTAQLEAANKELDAFSYSVSHDLRAPLRAIDGFASILQEDFGNQMPADAHDCMNRIKENAQRMGALIEDLLAFARLNQQPLRKQLVDMRALAADVIAELDPSREGRRAEVTLAGLPAVQADRALMRQVWTNLISNAFKFTRGRDIAKIEIGARNEEAHVVFFVRDNGAGFDMAYADKLFGVFQRLHRADEFEGTGVGLSLVQRIVARHGGRIWAQAEVDKGALFCFTLPL